MTSGAPSPLRERIASLEEDVRRRDEKIKELRDELHEALALVDAKRDHVNDVHDMIDRWIDVFGMKMGDDGAWHWEAATLSFWGTYNELFERHSALLRDWNRFVGRYNASIEPRGIGRPLAASDHQVKDVLRRKKAGASLRAIVEATNLTMRTVRTIIDRHQGTGRPGQRDRKLRKLEFDRLRAAEYRRRKREREALPAAVTKLLKEGEALLRAGKGLGEV